MRSARGGCLLALCLVGAIAAGCEDNPVVVTPQSFDRPEDVAFACIDVIAAEAVALANCTDPQPELDLRLHALVTQSARGELAVVDLDRNLLVDVNPSVPGYTFHPVGELPTAVSVSPDGQRAYVANSGSSSITVLDVGALRTAGGVLETIDLEGHQPNDVHAAEDTLFVTVPDEGLLLAIDLESGELRTLALGGGGVPVDTDGGVPDGGEPDGGEPDAGTTDAGADAGAEPGDGVSRPWQIAASSGDAAGTTIYVSNSALPVISIVDIATFTETGSLAIGAETTSLSVEPVDEGAVPHWLYAVEGTEGGVRVMDLETGRLVDTNRGTAERSDGEELEYDDPLQTGPAIDVPGIARAVEIFRRNAEGDAAPAVLDGTFAAVASSNGNLYVIDIEDADEEERRADPDEPDYVFIPHHLRPARRFTPDVLPALSGNPTVQVETTTAICATDYGFITHFGMPGAGPPPCDDAGRDIVMNSSYPWRSTNETWTVAFDGLIPATSRPRGNLEGTREVRDSAANYCNLGVQPGDDFVLTTIPTADEGSNADCGPTEEERHYRIAEVFNDHLVLEEDFDFESPEACNVDEWVDYEIHTADEWAVVGSVSGLLHSVIRDEEGRCVPDPDADPRLTGRAQECSSDGDCAFSNPFFTFTMIRGGGRSDPGTTWTFTTENAFAPLGLDIGDLPDDVRYLGGRDSLFVVDPAGAGLVEVEVTDLTITRSFE